MDESPLVSSFRGKVSRYRCVCLVLSKEYSEPWTEVVSIKGLQRLACIGFRAIRGRGAVIPLVSPIRLRFA